MKLKLIFLYRDKDGKSRGHAVIEFDHPVEAVQAISMFNDQALYDRKLTVRFDKSPGPTPEELAQSPSRLPAGLGRADATGTAQAALGLGGAAAREPRALGLPAQQLEAGCGKGSARRGQSSARGRREDAKAAPHPCTK